MTLFGSRNSLEARWRRALALTVLALGPVQGVSAQTLPEQPIPFDRLRSAFPAALVVAQGASACHRLDALLANTPARRTRGLMFVESMADDAGMLFTYPRPATLSIWMKNTLIPLDIIFADADGDVINITRGTPLSLESMRSARPARYVLELNAGRVEALGLGPEARLLVFEDS
ncbi:MAG: DUF192 domain-containing protein [Pseudomonadota bacterium]